MKNRNKVLLVLLFVVLLVVIWVVTFTIRSAQIDKAVEGLSSYENLQESEEAISIDSISVVIDNEKLSLDDFVNLETIPTIVDVEVTYKDGSILTKQAYVSYDDNISDIKYEEDSAYGRLIVPSTYKK